MYSDFTLTRDKPSFRFEPQEFTKTAPEGATDKHQVGETYCYTLEDKGYLHFPNKDDEVTTLDGVRHLMVAPYDPRFSNRVVAAYVKEDVLYFRDSQDNYKKEHRILPVPTDTIIERIGFSTAFRFQVHLTTPYATPHKRTGFTLEVNK